MSLDDVWSSDELAEALYEMGATIVERDDGSGEAFYAADDLLGLADELTGAMLVGFDDEGDSALWDDGVGVESEDFDESDDGWEDPEFLDDEAAAESLLGDGDPLENSSYVMWLTASVEDGETSPLELDDDELAVVSLYVDRADYDWLAGYL